MCSNQQRQNVHRDKAIAMTDNARDVIEAIICDKTADNIADEQADRTAMQSRNATQ